MRNSALILLLVLMISTLTCVERERSQRSPQRSETEQSNAGSIAVKRININTASASELETLPGIGKGFAEKIVEHREKYGPFRKPEHLLIVRGISQKRFERLRDLITVE